MRGMKRMGLAGLAVLGLVVARPAVASTDSGVPTATLVSMTRMVRVKDGPAAQPRAGTFGMALPEGSQVFTLADSRAHIRFDDGHFILLGANTSVVIQRLPKRGAVRTLVQLLKGKVQALIDRGKGEGDFGMYGATTITAVKGTDYEMTRDDADQVQVDVNEGKVDAAELKEKDDAAEAEKAMGMLIAGLIGMSLIEGQRVTTPRGGGMGKPSSFERKMQRNQERMDRRDAHEKRTKGGRDADGGSHGSHGGDSGSHGSHGGKSGKGGGGLPGGLPGMPF